MCVCEGAAKEDELMFLFKQTQRINLQKKHECRQETLLGAEKYAVVVAYQLKLLN